MPHVLLSGVPGREQAVVLDPATLRCVLDETPDPFAAASSEKRAALAHLQPDGVLATKSPERAERRRHDEAVLDADCPRHAFAARFQAVVHEEADALLTRRTALDWDAFAPAWWRAVRRVVLGDGARDDHALTDDMLQQLRSDANLAFLMASTMRGALMRGGLWAQQGGLRLDGRRPLPATFDNFVLRFARGA